jgi:PAS domain S-box-containing protein
MPSHALEQPAGAGTGRGVRRKTLAGATLLQVGVGTTLALALATLVGYRLISHQIEQRVLAQLNEYVVQRSQSEDELFRLARDLQQAIRRSVLAEMTRYRSLDALARFDELFMRYPDGAVRSRPSQTMGDTPITGWVHRDTPLGSELKQRMVLFHDVVRQFMPSALVRFSDIYFTAPEQVSLGTDPPGLTLWAMTVPPDFDQNAEEWAQIAEAQRNPRRETAWTGVYVDPVWNKLMVTVATPIDHAGRHLGSISFDHLIDDLNERLLAPGLAGARHAVFQGDGRLIAHSEKFDEIQAAGGHYFITASGDPMLMALLAAVQGSTKASLAGFDPISDQYYSISRLTGPSWYFASSIPGSLVRAQAFKSSQWVLWSGLGAFALLVPALLMVLRRQIAVPLARLTRAAERIAAGERISHLVASDHDELARLALAFNHMADKISERDVALREEKAELQQALAARRDTEERWRAMTRRLSDFIVVLDGDLRNVYVSPNMHTILGYSADERIGVTGFELVHPEDLDAVRQQIDIALAKPGTDTHPFRYRMRCHDGSYKYLEATWINLLENPAVHGIISNVRDVTDIVRAEQEIAQQREALYQAEKLSAMGSLLAGVAHELNNPLSVVVGRSLMLEEQAGTESTRQAAQKIRVAAERCARIVASFLAMARRQKARFAPVQIERVLGGALEMVEYGLRSHGITAELVCDEDLPEIAGDADQLHQVFTNLFVNAQHAMAEVSGTRRMTVRARRVEETASIIVEVIDTGTGMSPEVLARAFDPYFTTKPLGKGTGVGLSVSLGIVHAHGGKLSARNVEGGGTCVSVVLPVGKPVPKTSEVQASTAGTQRPQQVLIVDDEEEVRLLLADILEHAGHAVDTVASGSAALSRLAEQHCDIVITDLRMPDLDGQSLYTEIARRWPALALRTAFVTGDNLSVGIRDFLAHSGRPVIEKPFVPDEVRRVVAALAD